MCSCATRKKLFVNNFFAVGKDEEEEEKHDNNQLTSALQGEVQLLLALELADGLLEADGRRSELLLLAAAGDALADGLEFEWAGGGLGKRVVSFAVNSALGLGPEIADDVGLREEADGMLLVNLHGSFILGRLVGLIDARLGVVVLLPAWLLAHLIIIINYKFKANDASCGSTRARVFRECWWKPCPRTGRRGGAFFACFGSP